MKTSLLFLFLLVRSGESLLGYDCSIQDQIPLKFSSTNVMECPNFQGWYEKEEPVTLQLIKTPKEEKVTLSVCTVNVTTIAQYCGRFQNWQYGGAITLGRDEAYTMTKEECQKLIHNHEISYKGETWHVKKQHFSRDIVTKGFRDAERGTCVASEPFVSHNKHFPHHTLREILTVAVTEQEYSYDVEEKTMKIDEQDVPVDEEFHSSTKASYLWSDPSKTCDVGGHLKQGFYGVGLLFKPTNPNLPQMILVNDEKNGQVFGIELKTKFDKCGYSLYNTQLKEVKVAINITETVGQKWKIPRLQGTNLQQVDPVTNLQSLVGYNFVSLTSKLSDALADLSTKSCTNKRAQTLSELAIMRIDANEGTQLIFGRGYHAVLRGNIFYLYKCQKKQFQYRALPEDYQDIPVVFQENGETRTGFLDSLSYKLKKSSISYANNGILPISFDFQGSYKCKQEHLIDCGRPLELGHNFDEVKKDLVQKKNSVSYDGGLDDLKTRIVFRETVDEDSDIEANNFRVGQAALKQHTVKETFSLFNLEDLKNEILSTALLGGWWTWAMKVLGIICGIIGIYLMVSRCLILRRSKSTSFKNNYWNYLNAFGNSARFHSNHALGLHEDMKEEFNKMKVFVFKSDGKTKDEEGARFQELEEGILDNDSSSNGLEKLASHYPRLPPHDPTPPIVKYD